MGDNKFLEWLEANNCQVFTDENYDIVAAEENGGLVTSKALAGWLWRKVIEFSGS